MKLLTFVTEKRWGKERKRRPDQELLYCKLFITHASYRSHKKSQISSDFQRQICKKKGQILREFRGNFLGGQISLQCDWFCTDYMNSNSTFTIFFFCGEKGGGGRMMITTTTKTSTTYICCLFKTGPPLAL